MTREEALALFHKKGFSVEYQEDEAQYITGNFDVVNNRHNKDLVSVDYQMYYYICEPETAEKYYDLEFRDAEDLTNFIVYVMENDGPLDKIGEDEDLARQWRDAAGVSPLTVYTK